jgi:predicted AlkP superfamily pyrophosphatase or phosphodiesterase
VKELKMIILGIDALDKKMVEEFKCRSLMQANYGQTDISDFELPKTVVLWSSFLTGKNMEDEIKEDLWEFKLPKERTFFKFFSSFKAIDVPAFTLNQKEHALERKYLAGYFKNENTVEEFDKVVWANHEKNKKEFFSALDDDYEIVMVYFDLIDAIGHLSFGIEEKMKEVYRDVDGIVGEITNKADCPILIVSDHGMGKIGKGRYGDHTMNGFWSSNRKLGLNLNTPRITDFFRIISKAGGSSG